MNGIMCISITCAVAATINGIAGATAVSSVMPLQMHHITDCTQCGRAWCTSARQKPPLWIPFTFDHLHLKGHPVCGPSTPSGPCVPCAALPCGAVPHTPTSHEDVLYAATNASVPAPSPACHPTPPPPLPPPPPPRPPPLRPSWPPNYAMNASTYSGYLNADYTGLAADVEAAAIARHGLITLSWMQDICHNSRNTTPPSCQYAHTDESLRQQAAALKRLNPTARVLVYRNCALGLSSYAESCIKMYDTRWQSWWLRTGDSPSGAILRDSIDPTEGVRADRTAFNCTPGVAWQAGRHLLDQYLWDYRLPEVQEYLVEDLRSLVAGGAAGADGVWLDDTAAFNEHMALERGYSKASVAAVQEGLLTAAESAQRNLTSIGKWVYHFQNNVQMLLVNADRATCEKNLLESNVTGATQNMFGTMQLDTFLPNETSSDHDFLQNLAAFLLTRGNYSFFGTVGPGDAAVFSPLSGSRWFAEYDYDYGIPVAGMRTDGNGLYSREWSRVTVKLDCKTFQANFDWKQ